MLGRHLVELGIPPSPRFGKLLDQAYEAQMEGEFTDVESGRVYLKSIIEHSLY
jgi:tRNA nucleotidyltransferase (CCA-adding enzyme)